jgi:putative transposase
MVNDCVRIGLENDVSTMKKLSLLSYEQLAKYDIYANYKLCAISRAAGILAARKKSIKRGYAPKNPYAIRRC